MKRIIILLMIYVVIVINLLGEEKKRGWEYVGKPIIVKHVDIESLSFVINKSMLYVGFAGTDEKEDPNKNRRFDIYIKRYNGKKWESCGKIENGRYIFLTKDEKNNKVYGIIEKERKYEIIEIRDNKYKKVIDGPNYETIYMGHPKLKIYNGVFYILMREYLTEKYKEEVTLFKYENNIWKYVGEKGFSKKELEYETYMGRKRWPLPFVATYPGDLVFLMVFRMLVLYVDIKI